MIVRDVPPPVFAKPPARVSGHTIPPPRPWPLAEHPAFLTEPESDWAILSCHFNPAQHRRPVENLGAFADWCHGNRLPVYMAELSFNGAFPVLPNDSQHVLQFNLGDNGVMFQKEALLSRLAMSHVVIPPSVTKLFFVDADVTFSDPECFAKAALLLDSVPLVQPFSRCEWQNERGTFGCSKMGMAWAATCEKDQPDALDHTLFHSGFAVGLRREFFRAVGPLYGCPITGTGDAALWQAALAPHSAPPAPGRSHYSAPSPEAWRARVATYIGGKVGCVPGVARHFWHGTTKGRAYDTRHHLLPHFDPARHLTTDPASGLPVWTPAGHHLQTAMTEYFLSRAEDTP